LHDQEQAKNAEQHFEQTVQADQVPSDAPTLGVKPGTNLLAILKSCPTGLSSNELRRLVEQGGVKLIPSGEKPTSIDAEVDLEKVKTIQIGKRRFFNLEVLEEQG